MNKDQTKEAIKVMQAYVDGEEIEVIDRDDPNAEWKPYSDRFDWDFDCHKYRVKPKPLECFVVVSDGNEVIEFSTCKDSLAKYPERMIVKMREVTE